MAPVLGYWNIRGLAQPIRLLLNYKEAVYEDKRYNYGPAPDFSREEWNKEKYSLGLSFPNLPYYIDGDTKLTQSKAILRHLARKYELDGQTESEKQRIDQLCYQLTDLMSSFTSMCYNPDFEKLKPDYIKGLPEKLKSLAQFLGENKFVTGENISFVDFLLFEFIDQQLYLLPNCLNEFPNLKDFHSSFKAIPTIEKYLKSDQYIKWPLNGDRAKFGSRHNPPEE
ncbi:glutathione S-transferase Mu 1 [Tetranychus urticae]|uniref:Glutathione S-transferase n=1 Tax=Tetranychus urticae TaxID=32264 RepID=T1K0V7_TETUR|nr:glutathione S-transferase Mu 1 [Tetranychus urticae]